MSDDKPSSADLTSIQEPPTRFAKILTKIGPGLIIAGSIVGSGELIATTSTGAKAGFTLLWLIIVGCLIKVFVQIELGRFTLTNGITSIRGLNMLPGPKIEGKGNWFIWYWFVMFIAIMFQLGGIVGGVGQAMSISMPLTTEGRDFNDYRNSVTYQAVLRAQYDLVSRGQTPDAKKLAQIADEVLRSELTAFTALGKLEPKDDSIVIDTKPSIAFFDRLSETTDPEEVYFRDAILSSTLITNYGEALRDVTDALEAYSISGNLPGEAGTAVLDKALEALNESKRLSKDQTVLLSSQVRASKAGGNDIDIKEVMALVDEYTALQNVPELKEIWDDKYYAIGLTLVTIVLLVVGRYGFIQIFSTVLVGLFTLVTIANVFGLQMMDSAATWRITWANLQEGLSFGVGGSDWREGLGVALATFGIIGVGAAELIAYPYWCMEQGYAKFTGVRDDSDEWAARARGWMKVMQVDAWASAFIYTFATIAFYLLGAAILGPDRANLQPAGTDMVRSLGVMYKPVFGDVAESMFLFGAIAVLYSTFFVATAGNARMFSDVLGTLGLIRSGEKSYRKSVKIASGVLPAICGITYCFGVEPVFAVLLSGLMQSIMLPMLGFAAIYFRYKYSDKRIAPSALWDFFVVLSAIGLLIAGGVAVYTKLGS